jgi:hypothetical protein
MVLLCSISVASDWVVVLKNRIARSAEYKAAKLKPGMNVVFASSKS